MVMVFTLELLNLTLSRMKIIVKNVDGTLIAGIQGCGLDLLTITMAKNMDQGRRKGSMCTQETAFVL